ncbi:MAG: hypothetical protein HN644_05450 [Rhodospirillales bacterium]|nr:hypothetical protein [Rhodospirillales bacterium]MBT4040575.1 hypothetical protein [Rhodospirillales bacterium]MBT4627020.1 hypothetical protein [Rhodospirillales bacterium]MBT5352221.1 hypothetical protein [Rhodospirillales bacterium]MBT5520605.1 hypothetical protein [Rhodospirillales bacterium]
MLYTTQALHDDEVLTALPLMQMCHPHLTLDSWQEKAKELKANGGGVVAVKYENGCIYGILVFEMRCLPCGDKIISATDIISLKLTGQENCRSRLLDWIDEFAQKTACKRVEINLS